MFGFTKKKDKEKDREKEERKKEKREKKEKEKKDKLEKKKEKPLTQEDLLRLDEAKKGLFRRLSDRKASLNLKGEAAYNEHGSPGKLKKRVSGSDGTGSSNSISSTDQATTGTNQLEHSGSFKSEQTIELQPTNTTHHSSKFVGPKPPPKPKRGILKDHSNYGSALNNHSTSGDPDDSFALQENTVRNEMESGITGDKTVIKLNSRDESISKQETTKVNAMPKLIDDLPKSPTDKSYDIDLKMPDLSPPELPEVRQVTLKRQPGGGFGFTLRRGMIVERKEGAEEKRMVVFAEPGGGARSTNQIGLLPGDRLVEVNGVNVEESNREDIIEMVKMSVDAVVLSVQPVPELSELSVRSGPSVASFQGGDRTEEKIVKSATLKRSGSLKYKKTQAKSEGELAAEKAWLETEKVWLVHKGGYAAAHIISENGTSGLPEGKVKVKLDHGGQVLEVEEEDVEKCNPPQYDRSEDLASMRYLNESGALHILRQRYGSNLIHSYAGQSLLVVNPMHQLSIYSEKVIQMFRGCKQEDMPPHIYATTQIAYRNMLTTRRDQSLVFTGRSGSGKTTNARHALTYLTLAAGSVNNIVTVDKINAISVLLDAFGNSRTVMNTNASRFCQVTSVDFDMSGQIAAASVQVLMLEKTRVVRRPEGEPTFHIFYYMLAGIDQHLRSELHLQTLTEPNLFMTPLQKPEDRQRASQIWTKIQASFESLGVSQDDSKTLFLVLAAIYHLGTAGAIKGANNKFHFVKPASAQKAASILGSTVEDLSKAIFSPSSGVGSGTLTRASTLRTPSPGVVSPEMALSPVEALEGFVTGLYNEVVNALVALINRSLSSTYRSLTSIILLDTPGFQNPASVGRTTGSSFEDLCHNYTQERLQLLFHETTFTSQQDIYSQEGIDIDTDTSAASPIALVDMIDKPSTQNLLKSSNPDLKRDYEQRGLLWLLDEEAIFPGASDESFMERLMLHHTGHIEGRRDSLLKRGSHSYMFTLSHLHGTNPIHYNTKGWLKVCRENPISKVAIQVLLDSQKHNVAVLFGSVHGPVSSIVSGSVAGMEGSSSLRRASSMRRVFVSGQAGIKRKSVCLQVKFQVDSVMETLKRTRIHFVHCLLPQHNAGLCELRSSLSPNQSSDDVLMNVPLVRQQLRGSDILEAVRIYRQGFPEHMAYGEFHHRFEVLIPPEQRSSGPIVDEKQAVEKIVAVLEVDKSSFRLGLSQIFFRAGAFSRLEDCRDEKITDMLVAFQRYCRGYVARKALNILKVQQLAVKCVQRNVRKFMFIREWPWWKLYTKVQPLLNVHRTEEELHDKEVELENVKNKLEKIEKERNLFKVNASQWESKLTEVTADLTEEQTTSTHATEMFEAETAERMRLEKELKDLQSRHDALQRKNEKMEIEVMQAHLSVSHADQYDDDDMDDSIYKDRYQRAVRELDFTKKQLKQQHEEDIEQHVSIKKQVERKLHEAIAEVEEQKGQSHNMKRKSHRLQGELQDMKLHLEEQLARNAELEKKQRKFDNELHRVMEDLREEKFQHEKVQRELDQIKSEKYSKEKAYQNLKMEFELQNEQIERLQRELTDLSNVGSKDDAELVNLKRSKHELEIKVKDQEEELEEQATTIHQLEQTKLRLEMNTEKTRQQHVKELDDKETEMEEMRYSTQRKLKQFEAQMEEEYEEKQKIVREKRELEHQLKELEQQKPKRNVENEKRLRKDLKKTKALLKDAQIMLNKQKDGRSERSTVKQLRNQLDDAEYATAAAVKARKGIEIELMDLQQQLEDISKVKTNLDNSIMISNREKNDLTNQLEENDEEIQDHMKKYKALVQQQSVDHITLTDQSAQIAELSEEREMLKEQINNLSSKLEYMDSSFVQKHTLQIAETKIKDLESRLDLETSQRHRFEAQYTRLKEQVEKLSEERDNLKAADQQSLEVNKRLQRQLRDLREELGEVQKREIEASSRRQDLEIKVETLEADYEQSQADLKLAFKRIEDLQAVVEEDIESGSDLSDSDGEGESDSSTDIDTFLSNHQQRPISSASYTSVDMSQRRSRTISDSRSSSISHEGDISNSQIANTDT